MKQIIAVDFQIKSETVDSSNEDNWDTLLRVLKEVLAIYDEAHLKSQKRLQRPKTIREPAAEPKTILLHIPKKHLKK